jgi:hypothetical protein
MHLGPSQVAWGREGLRWQSEEPSNVLLHCFFPEVPHAVEREITRRYLFID